MKKTQAAMAASVLLSTALVAGPAFAQFGMLGALASARANTGKANAATNAVASVQAAGQASAMAFSSEGLPPAAALVAPTPIAGAAGKYMSPISASGEPAAWVARAVAAANASGVGAVAGNMATDKLAEQAGAKLASMVPVPGLGMLAQRATKQVTAAAGKGMAAQAYGGEAFVRSSSDQSFNTVQDLAIYLYVNHSGRADYANLLKATAMVYPDFQTSYQPAVQSASLK